MNKDKKKLARSIATLITSAIFLIISLLFVVASLIMYNNDTIDNQSDVGINADVEINSSIDTLENSSEVILSSEVPEENQSSIVESSEESSEAEEVILNHDFIHNKYGHTFVYGDSGFEQFNYGEKALKRYVDGLNSLSELFPKETKVYNITVPISTTYASIPREIYVQHDFYNKEQGTFVSTVEASLNENITNIPIVSKLRERYDNGEYIFFRTDNNWTPLAAYTAYAEFCEAVGLNAYAITSFPTVEVGDFLGRFYFATQDENMKKNPDKFTCYSTVPSVNTSLTVYNGEAKYTNYNLCDNKVDINNAYDIFVGTTAGRYEINTTVNGGNLLLIGDSSIYPMLPFLASHYGKIDVINPNVFESSLSEFLQNRQYDNVITMCYTTNATAGDNKPACNNCIEVTIGNE